MSAWRLGAVYAMPDGERARLVETERTLGSEEAIGKFEALDRKTLYVVPLSKLAPHKKAADVSLRIVANAQPYLDALADIQAKMLADDGWYCISGKHLRIARVADPYVRAIFERASMPDEVKADKLRRKFASTSPAAETKTVDVDTYVALKKLRRARAAVDTFRKSTGDVLRSALGSRPRPRLQDWVVNDSVPVKEKVGDWPHHGTVTGRFQSQAEHESRYIAELEALPDSLFKRVRLRSAKLPQRARADLGACKKAFDREVAKWEKQR